MEINKNKELWVTNTSSNKDINISDLRITIRCGQSINLYAKNKRGKSLYNITLKDIENSINSGSLLKKRNFLKIREVAPVLFTHIIESSKSTDRNSTRLTRKATDIEKIEYPDLDFEEEEDESVEKFAEQNADVDFEDRCPALAVDPKYKKSDLDE